MKETHQDRYFTFFSPLILVLGTLYNPYILVKYINNQYLEEVSDDKVQDGVLLLCGFTKPTRATSFLVGAFYPPSFRYPPWNDISTILQLPQMALLKRFNLFVINFDLHNSKVQILGPRPNFFYSTPLAMFVFEP